MTPRDRLMWLLCAGFLMGYYGCQTYVDRTHSQSVVPLQQRALNLDAGAGPDWTLPVTVGQTEFGIPRAELKQWVLRHPEWRK